MLLCERIEAGIVRAHAVWKERRSMVGSRACRPWVCERRPIAIGHVFVAHAAEVVIALIHRHGHLVGT